MLAELSFSFSLIGLIETWINNYSDHSMDFHLPGYTFISQPTKLKAEGVDAFIHDDINFHIRDDLSFSTDECEMLWVEVAFLFVCLFVRISFLTIQPSLTLVSKNYAHVISTYELSVVFGYLEAVGTSTPVGSTQIFLLIRLCLCHCQKNIISQLSSFKLPKTCKSWKREKKKTLFYQEWNVFSLLQLSIR